jgi:hypothetical protein
VSGFTAFGILPNGQVVYKQSLAAAAVASFEDDDNDDDDGGLGDSSEAARKVPHKTHFCSSCAKGVERVLAPSP